MDGETCSANKDLGSSAQHGRENRQNDMNLPDHSTCKCRKAEGTENTQIVLL